MSKPELNQKLLNDSKNQLDGYFFETGVPSDDSDNSDAIIIVPSNSKSPAKSSVESSKPNNSKWRYKFTTKRQQKACNIIIITLFLLAFILSFLLRKPNAPVLYMTSHRGNIIAYNAKTTNSKVSQLITTNLLNLNSEEINGIQRQNGIQFRQMFTNNDHLIVANGNNNFTFISIWECDQEHNQWRLTDYFADNITHLIHPYGIQWYHKKQWYIITAQATNYIFIMDKSHQTIKQIAIKPAVANSSSSSFKGLRSVAVDNDLDLAFIASPDTQNILIFDILNGFNNLYNITLPSDSDESEPISILMDPKTADNIVYITDRINNKIFAFTYNQKSYSLKWISTYCSYLQSPTGLAIDNSGNHLFVISQGVNKILVYDKHSGIFETEFTSWSPSTSGIDAGEQLLFVNANSQCAIK